MKETAMTGSDGGQEGRLNNNKADVEEDDQDLLRSAIMRPRRREIGKNSSKYNRGERQHHSGGTMGSSNRRTRTRRCTRLQLVPFPLFSGTFSTMIMLPIYFGLLSQVGIFPGGVEGNSEIESCVLQTRSSGASSSSSSATSSANGLGYYSGSSVQNNGGSGVSGAGASGSSSSSSGGNIGGTNNGLVGGGGGANNNYEAAAVAAALVDPHSTVLCHIRILHMDLDMENLTSSLVSSPSGGGSGVVDMSSITRLKLVCNDVLFFESNVSPGQLRSLSELHDLTIDKCKLKHLPSEFFSGLRHLRKLTINTGNSDWASRSLELSPGALSDVPQLRHLNLGFNHIYLLPEGVLCKLLSIQSLNVTHNLLSDIDDLGLPGKPALGSVKNSAEYDLASSSSGGDGSSTSGSSSCLAELKSLDVSYNSLRTLGSRRMEHLKRLQDLRLEHNWLEELEDDALHGLGQLRLLHLYSNRLVALPTKLFQPCKLLRELDLSNNSLTALSPGLLNGLEHLQILNLSMNSLSSQWITADAFKSLVRLVILNLSHNQLTHLAPSTFHDLYTLQVLDLGSNLISSIADGTFAPMSNLHSLNLARNRLVTINNMFNGLYVLHKLSLDYNQIDSIQSGAMTNCTSLQDLSLIGNSLQEVPQALSGLKMLKTLDLGENKITKLRNDSFSGMSQLIGLRIVDNLIEEIPKGFCDPVTHLRVFNCAQNKISKISYQSFLSCPELRVLRLDSNRLEEIPSTLAPQLPNLLWLNVSQNTIKRVDFSLLPATLEWLDVSRNNGLEYLGGAWSSFNSLATSTNSNSRAGGRDPRSNGGNKNSNLVSLSRTGGHQHQHNNNSHHHNFADHPNARLRVIDASFNKLTELDYTMIPPFLETLRLNNNEIKSIAPDTFSRATRLRRVELIGNSIETIKLTALRIPPVPHGKPLPEFFLGGNPFFCSCELEWLTRINQLASLRQHPIVLDLDAIVCRVYSRTITHIPFPEIKNSDFLCPYLSHCFHLCHCCEFDACDCAMSCPSNCTCYHDDTWSANVVNCAHSGHAAIPSRLPMDSTEVYLDGNTIKTLKSHTFIGRKNLRVLYLNGSYVEVISNKSFNGLQSLLTLHLEDNRLKALHGYEFDHLTRLRELYLQNNLIETISNTTFLPLKSLEILRIDNNRLVVFTVWQLSLNPYLVEIGLAKNRWSCSCDFLHNLYAWINDNGKKVVDLVQLQCVWDEPTHKPGPHLIDYNRTCGSSWSLMGIENGLDFTLSPLPLALAFVSLVTLLILVVALVIICRENLSLWLFARFNGFRLCAATDYDDAEMMTNDAYVIYCEKDEDVAQRIADELETNDNYRLCLHYRDLICETGDKEMMIGAVENSKSILIILSRNFLQGEWSSGEYRSAFHSVLKKSQREGLTSSAGKTRPKKILIVFIEDIPKVEINPDIRSWVRHNKIQVIKWNIHSTDYGKNRKFWNKLKFTLPDPSSHYHSNITSNTTTTSASSGESHGGIMTTLKYATTMQGDGHLQHSMNHHHNIQQHPHHLQHQIIVDESGRFTTTSALQLPPASSSQTNTLNSTKYWPYGATNFVALPPKYQQSSHHSSGGSHPPSVNSPGSAQSTHYHPPLPLSNPPKSPPSSQSTDSTTTTMADDAPSLMSQLTMASYHSNSNGHSPLISSNNMSATKSPVPVPKSSYSSSRNNLVSNSPSVMHGNHSSSSNSNSTTIGGPGGESYLSIDGEHVYSTLDPPSPQPIQQSMSLSQNILANNISNNTNNSASNGAPPNFLSNIHLPNGFTYQHQPQPNSLNHHSQQWLGSSHHHPSHHLSSANSTHHNHHTGGKHHHQQHPHQAALSNFPGSSISASNTVTGNGGSKVFKQIKDGSNNPVQTYLV